MDFSRLSTELVIGVIILSFLYLMYLLYEDYVVYNADCKEIAKVEMQHAEKKKNRLKSHSVLKSCVSSAAKGALISCVTAGGGLEAAVTGGVIYCIVAPISHCIDRHLS